MLQRGGVYPMLGPRRVLTLFAGYYPEPVPPDELLDLVGLRAVAATPWRHLSGGEQQRLSLALALVGRPEVAFLDEPTAGVDPEGRIAVRAVVAALKERGVCVVLTTHELGEAEKMADRIVILSAGRVVLEGTPHGLTAGAGTGSGAAGTGAQTAVRPSRSGHRQASTSTRWRTAIGSGTTVTETAPGRYRVETSTVATPAVTAAVANFLAARGATLTDLTAGKTLEDVYFETVGAAAANAPDESPAAGAGRLATGAGGGAGEHGHGHHRAPARQHPAAAHGPDQRRDLHDAAPRRDPAPHPRHPRRLPALLLEGLGGRPLRRRHRPISSCPAFWRSPSCRRPWSPSASPPASSAATAC